MHWIESGDPFKDCCVHGGVYLRLGEINLSDGTDLDWSVSTAAFNLLRTLFEDQPLIGREALIPHCGHTMWPIATEPDGLYLPNCDIGINWSITHEGNRIFHEFPDGTHVIAGISEWKSAVCKFADEVMDFMHTAWPKVIDDEQDKHGFELFLSLWKKRRAEAGFENGS
jgi:hypothetical protein